MAPLRAQAPAASQTFQHFTHPNHPLQKTYMPAEYKCDGCTSLGYGTRYRCTSAACDFDLHEQCATCPSTLPFQLHPHHGPLTLVNRPGNGHVCDLCQGFVNGLFYTCRACDFEVHPLCTQLPLHVRHPFHPQHPLTLQPGVPGTCDLCLRGCAVWRYRCGACDVDVHLECVAEPFSGPSRAANWVPPLPLGGYLNGVQGGGGGGGGDNWPPGGYLNGVQAGGGGGGVNGSNGSGKIYSVVGKLAAKVVLGSMFGSPTGLF